jgi:NAD(P)-dependent dehydrogenase (short-subunit alcohol dehydrogenase family)
MPKTILITGANSGIGLAAACELASQGHRIIAWCRSKEKGKAALKAIQESHPQGEGDLVLADLGNLKAVNAAAEELLVNLDQLDVLLNNAGYYPPEVSFVNGVEKSLYACQLGHMLLSLKLMPLLEASGEGRIIMVSSAAHAMGKAERLFNAPEKYSAIQVYSDVKLANVLLSKGLQKRMEGPVTSYSLHPGVVRTGFTDNLSGFFKFIGNLFVPFMLTPAKGARTSIHLCTAPIEQLQPNAGDYFAKSKPKKITNKDVTEANADVLWEKSMEYLQPFS